MIIRLANLNDEDSILKIHQQAIEADCKNHYTQKQIKSWAVPQGLPPFEEQLQLSMFFVAEENGENLGFASREKKDAKIETLFVKPNHFGQGIGQKLLETLEATFEQHINIKITVDSTLNAVSFYKRHGYNEGPEVIHTEPDGTRIECVRMIKTLL